MFGEAGLVRFACNVMSGSALVSEMAVINVRLNSRSCVAIRKNISTWAGIPGRKDKARE